jgi:hypothetical protein
MLLVACLIRLNRKDRGWCGGGAAIARARDYRHQQPFPAALKIGRAARKILAATSQKSGPCLTRSRSKIWRGLKNRRTAGGLGRGRLAMIGMPLRFEKLPGFNLQGFG